LIGGIRQRASPLSRVSRERLFVEKGFGKGRIVVEKGRGGSYRRI